MNKIYVDNIIYDDKVILLKSKEVKRIVATGDCIINILDCLIKRLTIEVKDDSKVTINYFKVIDELDSLIDIKVKNKSCINFNHSFKVIDNYNLKIQTDFLGNESSINVNINGLNDGAKSVIDVNGYVKEKRINNVLNENMKFININNGLVMSNPNMYIDTSKVVANHNTTIGGVSPSELFYLTSKGLSEEASQKLICNGFLVNIIDSDDLRIKVREILK